MIDELPRSADGTRLILVRHGAPEAAASGRCYGALDVGLSTEGVAQAARTAAWLAGAPLAAVSSPRRRALDTAAPIARAHALEVRVEPALRELDFGELEGLTYDEVARRHPALWAEWMARPTEVTFPGGESYAMLRARVLAAADGLRRAHTGSAIALVAHGGSLRTIVADALGLADADVFRIDLSYAAVSVVDWLGATPAVRLLNLAPSWMG
jgi:alpha-ribazole phosphatase/probable phosphoglycerate mutase